MFPTRGSGCDALAGRAKVVLPSGRRASGLKRAASRGDSSTVSVVAWARQVWVRARAKKRSTAGGALRTRTKAPIASLGRNTLLAPAAPREHSELQSPTPRSTHARADTLGPGRPAALRGRSDEHASLPMTGSHSSASERGPRARAGYLETALGRCQASTRRPARDDFRGKRSCLSVTRHSAPNHSLCHSKH